MLFDVSLEEREIGIVPTLIPPGLGLWLFSSFPLPLNVTISDNYLLKDVQSVSLIGEQFLNIV